MQNPLPKQQIQKKSIDALSGILTRYPSSGAARKLFLRLQLHRDRPTKVHETACHWSLFAAKVTLPLVIIWSQSNPAIGHYLEPK
jgi:hypothetical protein